MKWDEEVLGWRYTVERILFSFSKRVRREKGENVC